MNFYDALKKLLHVFMNFLLADRYPSSQNDFKPDNADKCS